MNSIEFTILKTEIVPRIQELILRSNVNAVQINGLVCLGRILSVMDKWLVHELLLPFLETVPYRDAGTMMALHGIYTLILSDAKYGMDSATAATRIVPFIAPMLMEPVLNAAQCEKLLGLLQTLLKFVEGDRLAALRKKESMTKEQSTVTGIGSQQAGVSTQSFAQQVKADAPSSFDVKAASEAAAHARMQEEVR